MSTDEMPPTPTTFEELVRGIAYVPAESAPAYLHDAIRRRVGSIHALTPATTDAEELIAEVDSERIISLVGRAQPALEIIAACIVELGTTAEAIEREIRRIDMQPVAQQPTLAHLGIDIAYIVAFRALTREQRWLMHTLAVWAPRPATIVREAALVVARGSGRYAGLVLSSDDLARLVALGLVAPDEAPLAPDQLVTEGRIALDPYIRFIAVQGLAEWPLPDADPAVTAEMVLASVFVQWAVSFAEVIAGPDMTPLPDAEDEDEDEADVDEPHDRLLTPDPDLAELTAEEAWEALRPELPHILIAALLAGELGAAEYVFRLCQLLPPRLQGRTEAAALRFRRELLELGLQNARQMQAPREMLLLTTQLTDVALDAGDLADAASSAQAAMEAALAVKDLRAIAFAARRQAAIAIRRNDRAVAMERARQAVATANASGDQDALREALVLLVLQPHL